MKAKLTAASVWLGFALLLLLLGLVPFTLSDQRWAGQRASIVPNVWLPTFSFDDATLLHVGAWQTQVSLAFFALAMVGIEALLGYLYRKRTSKLVSPTVRGAAIFLVFWSIFGHLPLWDVLLSRIFPTSPNILYPRGSVIELAGQHLVLVIVSSLVTITVGLSIGILVTRPQFREFLPIVSDIVSAGQTIPTLAMVAIMVPILGLGFWPAIIALIVYGLLPVVRNTIAGLETVDPFMIDAGRGMGMTPLQILFKVELPSASRVILAGVRTSAVVNIGTAALGAYAGSGGLGGPIAGGLNQNIIPYVIYGALPAALLAVLVDYLLGNLEFVITPRGLQIES